MKDNKEKLQFNIGFRLVGYSSAGREGSNRVYVIEKTVHTTNGFLRKPMQGRFSGEEMEALEKVAQRFPTGRELS